MGLIIGVYVYVSLIFPLSGFVTLRGEDITQRKHYPPKLSEDDPIQEFGGRVMQELFQTLPGEKVLIKKYTPVKIDFNKTATSRCAPSKGQLT
ncbi:hypothetical protein D7V90_11470 [bacterium 1xD42-87]|nr:hypothetical protein D7V90_11470 [bacterium 1xD42-87]